MNTPIIDFIRSYHASGSARLHMPGHKGQSFLGCEHLDITEISGADSLYEATGIIAESEKNATALFGSGRTLYSTEGSSQCIRAMLHLAIMNRQAGTPPVVVAARNVHTAFVYAAALLDFEIVWLWPEEESRSICGCPISLQNLVETLDHLPTPPAAVYLTSPDYLGNLAEIAAIAEVCHSHRTLLAVDNAHGAYLHFLTPPSHPLDLGADLCCDSAHKTLPVLTGGAYLHIAKNAPLKLQEQARNAMALFGSTSPSYLTLASLDLCNRYLADCYTARLAETIASLTDIGTHLSNAGWQIEDTDPLRLTIAAPAGLTGTALSERLRKGGIVCEYADPEFLVMMISTENSRTDLERVESLLGKNLAPAAVYPNLPLAKGERVLSVRQALFSPHEEVEIERSFGRICGAPTVACPPAIPVAVSGERIGSEAISLFHHYGNQTVAVLK